MSAPILATKLYVPTAPPNVVHRPRLVKRLDEGLYRKLTLVSAAAGFGKTTLVSEWVAGCGRPAAWLSLDEGDSDRSRFLIHLVAAMQTIEANIGAGVLGVLQSPQPPSTASILTNLLNETASIQDHFILVLDDYHVVDSRAVDEALAFLLEHLPRQMHLVIATREDPHLPLARLRARGQLNELRATDLRFTQEEAAEFLNQTMGLNISAEDVDALETRTEGWIAGLQLAAISMQGYADTTSFIKSFTGSHRFVLDYLMEEVLQQQPDRVKAFLLNTSILNRMCGSLCNAVLGDPSASGQEMLEQLEHTNLFIVPLDNERHWYRYHHLFAELLRQRLRQQSNVPGEDELHRRASTWFEEQGLEIEAFRHAAAGNDIERAERLIDGKGSPLYVRGGTVTVLDWLKSLPASTLDARPWMWITFATVLSIVGKASQVEPKLQAAESVMDNVESAELKSQLAGRIKNLREMVGILMADPLQMDAIISRLSHVETDASNLPPAALWLLGLAFFFKGERSAAATAFSRSISVSEATGNVHVTILATTSIGKTRELEIRLQLALETYQRVLQLVGDPPGPVACEAYAGIARILYEWNDLVAARRHAEKSLELALQLEIASFVTSELVLAQVQLAEGDASAASAALARTAEAGSQRNFRFRLPDVAAMQVRASLKEGSLDEAASLALTHELPIGRARVDLARGNTTAALATLETQRRKMEARGWERERLEVMILQALAHHAHGDHDTDIQILSEVLAIAEPEGLVRTFVDEGAPMAQLLSVAASRGIRPDYVARLLAAFDIDGYLPEPRPVSPTVGSGQPLAEPLSQRELEILHLIANGLSNRQISERLYLALATVKGHNRNIFGKLQVQRRTEAVARARELGLF